MKDLKATDLLYVILGILTINLIFTGILLIEISHIL